MQSLPKIEKVLYKGALVDIRLEQNLLRKDASLRKLLNKVYLLLIEIDRNVPEQLKFRVQDTIKRLSALKKYLDELNANDFALVREDRLTEFAVEDILREIKASGVPTKHIIEHHIANYRFLPVEEGEIKKRKRLLQSEINLLRQIEQELNLIYNEINLLKNSPTLSKETKEKIQAIQNELKNYFFFFGNMRHKEQLIYNALVKEDTRLANLWFSLRK